MHERDGILTDVHTQFIIDPKLTGAYTANIPGYTPPPYAGMAIFEAESIEKIYEVFADEEYVRLVIPDEERLFVRSKTIFLAGPYAKYMGA